MIRFWRPVTAAVSAALLAGGLLAAATGSVAASGYGQGAVYQIELSANAAGPQGGGVWLWIDLNADGTANYSGSDCGHGLGAVADKGDTTWWASGGSIHIPSVILNGLGGYPATVTVPSTYGHYAGTIGSFITLPPFIPPFIGSSQLQVAP